ncbi:MAG TPA: HDIG domain-containing protein [Spirochaetota bacterium]|nr:HDIG domain-containing protein [Spirochaetota bacterium]
MINFTDARRKINIYFRRPGIRNAFFYLLGIVVIATVLLSFNAIGKTYTYTVGEISHDDIKVPYDIRYTIETETEKERQREVDGVALVFDRDQSVLVERLGIVNALMNHVASTLKETPPIGTEDRTFQLILLKDTLPKYLQFGDDVLLELLRLENPAEFRKALSRIVIYLYERGILNEPYKNTLNLANKNVLIRPINASGEVKEITASLEDLWLPETARQNLLAVCKAIAPDLTAEQMRAAYQIVRSNLKPNLSFNLEETKKRVDEAAKRVKPATGVLKKGLMIVREGDVITSDALENINLLNRHTTTANVSYIVGIFLIQLLFLLIFGYFLVSDYSAILEDNKSSIVVFTLLLFFILFSFFVSRAENVHSSKFIFALVLPLSFVTMILVILYNIFLALLVGVYMVFFTFVISGFSFPSLVLGFSSAMLGTFIVGNVEKRTDFLKSGFVIGAANAFIVCAVGFMRELPFALVLRNVELSFANGVVNAILALGIIPVYENLFGISTRFKLLELSDLNAPIFKRMLIRAPGTYNHSLMVANMAEAACKDIGANALLARVGGYYHDIGKINDSGIYIENRVTDPRVKTFSPLEYSRLIISHVEKGVVLAREQGLPDSIVDFIREHHGKSVMTYFYHQALEAVEADGPDSVRKGDFQYPGPPPSSRESAVVMLADAIEAASRSNNEPNKAKLEGMVKKIIFNRLNDGDLEFSELTMSELNKIQRSFLRILFGIFHTRIEYPEKSDVARLEEKIQKKENGPAGNGE